MGGASSKGGRKQSNDVSVRVVEGMTIWYILTDTMDLGNSQGQTTLPSSALRMLVLVLFGLKWVTTTFSTSMKLPWLTLNL
jgi:hypothetical protein